MELKKFQLYVNEKKNDDEIPSYKNYIFKQGLLILDNGMMYSWKFFKNYNNNGNLFIKTKKPGVLFQFIQGNPVISVPVTSDKAGNIAIDDVNKFYASDEFRKLKRFVDLNKVKWGRNGIYITRK